MLDLNSMLLWLVGASSLFALLTMGRHYGRHAFKSLVAHLIVAILALYAGLLQPNWGGPVFAIWLLLVVAPALAAQQLHQALRLRQLPRAIHWGKVLGVLQPWLHGFNQVRYLEFEQALDSQDPAAVQTRLAALTGSQPWEARAQLELLRRRLRFDEIAEYFAKHPAAIRDPRLSALHVRALGELGDLNAMWQAYSQLPAPMQRSSGLRLTVVALSGRPDLLHDLQGPLTTDDPNLWPFWYASALQAAGESVQAAAILEHLLATNGRTAPALLHRLRFPLSDQAPRNMDASARARLANLEQAMSDERAMGGPSGQRRRPPRATLALCALLALTFVLSLPPDNRALEAHLIDMGALVLPVHQASGPLLWRLFAAGVLHFGPAHLFTNMLGLWVLGRQVERLFSGAALCFVFFAASLSAMYLSVLLMTPAPHQTITIVGASCGVMGLVGALLTFAALGHFITGNALSRQSLLQLGLVVLMQTGMDLITPATSAQLHLSGAAAGAFWTLPLGLRYWLAQRHEQQRSPTKSPR